MPESSVNRFVDQSHDLCRLDSRILRRMDPGLVHFLSLRPVDPIARSDNLGHVPSISIQTCAGFLNVRFRAGLG